MPLGVGCWETVWNFFCLQITEVALIRSHGSSLSCLKDSRTMAPQVWIRYGMQMLYKYSTQSYCFSTHKALPGVAYNHFWFFKKAIRLKESIIMHKQLAINLSVSTLITGHNQSWCSRRASKALFLIVFASFASLQDLESAPPEHQIRDQDYIRDFTVLVLPYCFKSTLLPSSVSAASCLSPWQCPRAGECPLRSSLLVFSHSQGQGGSLAPENESVNIKVKV